MASLPVATVSSKGLLFRNTNEVTFGTPYNNVCIRRSTPSISIQCRKGDQLTRAIDRSSLHASALSPELEEVGVSAALDGFSVSTTTTSEPRELKIRIDVTGAKTEAIFVSVFSKMVAAAQPIPGFRRVKGGKTPDIPRDVLIQVLGPSKVYTKVIKRVINSTIAEYVEKEGLKVTKDVRVAQSYEELEANFEPGEDFSFDALIHLQETDASKS